MRVLLVDDEPAALERLQALLAQLADVTVIGSAPEAGDTPRARRDDQAEGLLAIGSGLLVALALLAFWWFNRG